MEALITKIKNFFSQKRNFSPAIVFGIAITFGVLSWEINQGLIVQSDSTLNRIEYFFYDLRFKSTLTERERTDEHNIVIIDIDERSLGAEGHFPWSRHKMGKLVEKLAEQGVLVVAFDIVFSEAERNPATELMNNYNAGNIKGKLKELEKQADADARFSQSFNATDVILGYFFKNEEGQVGLLPPEIPSEHLGDLETFVIQPQVGIISNLEVLQSSARDAGFLYTIPDADGVIRRSPLINLYEGKLYPALSLAAGVAYLFAEQIDIKTSQLDNLTSINSVAIGEYAAATDSQGKVLVPFIGQQRSFPYISATDVLNDAVEPGRLENAVAFVGTSALGLADLKPTPVETGSGYPGVEVHANILLGLLEGGIPYKPDWENGLLRVLIIFIGLTLTFVLPNFGPIGLISLGLGTLSAYVATNYYLWSNNNFDLSMAPIVVLITSITILNIALGFFQESSRRKDLKDMFGQYVPPAHIDKMVDSADEDAFASDSREMTVLFSDIRSFTSISEGLSAEELKQLLNEYFTPITQIIFETEGTIDKYVGDMVMAFWGAPLEDPNHRLHAIEAALAMQEKTRELTEEFKKKGMPEIAIGVGLNTGTMNVGDMGSQYRKAYTVLGDAVNLGSRLESLTKFYGAECLVGEGTIEGVKDYIFRHVDRIQVKGKEEAVEVYEPLGKRDDLSSDAVYRVARFHEALDLYWQQNWDEAEAILKELKEQDPEVKVYEIYLIRIAENRALNLPVDWDGVFRHTSK